MSKGTGKNSQATRARQLIAGAKKHFTNGSTELQVGGATFTVTALTQLLQDFVDQRDAVEASKAATKAKIEAERIHAPSQIATIRAFVTVVRGMFGNSADALADFGLALHKARTPVTAEKKAAAVAKRAATRAARRTMGKNQKKDVKGAVKAELVVTSLDGSHPVAPSPAPAGSAPTGGSGGATPHA
jgi:hypothetical protein